ncbi:unnamed protein product [Coregonus sp. 'balchen']|nr:unnamed protein product [Coregonus sp. 'balchen']
MEFIPICLCSLKTNLQKEKKIVMRKVRKSLEVITEELRERHNYTCTVSHLSLDNKLDVSWEPEPDRDRVSLLSLSAPVVMVKGPDVEVGVRGDCQGGTPYGHFKGHD